MQQLIPRAMHVSRSIGNYSEWHRKEGWYMCAYAVLWVSTVGGEYIVISLIFVDCAECVTAVDKCFLQICCDVQWAGWEVVSDISWKGASEVWAQWSSEDKPMQTTFTPYYTEMAQTLYTSLAEEGHRCRWHIQVLFNFSMSLLNIYCKAYNLTSMCAEVFTLKIS
jgi:hypothetical protein